MFCVVLYHMKSVSLVNYYSPLAILVALVFLPFQSVNAQKIASVPVYQNSSTERWADSVFLTMSYPEKLGQLFMLDAFSNKDSAHVYQVLSLVDSFKLGGLIFFKGSPYKQALLTNHYQEHSRIPLMIGIDGEWGLSMRLDSTIRFPRQMTLAAGGDADAVYAMGTDIAEQCKRMGIQINFAPSVDINNNAANPIINSRSFGQEKEIVAELGYQYMKGMQERGVLACAKHFPGHGNTDVDSHLSLPIVNSSRAELDTMELIPFRKLFNNGVASVMVGHLFIPALDSTPNRAATLSPDVVTNLLQKEEGFNGLIFTDALNMKGVADYYPQGELELLAFKAGNDVLLYSENIPKAIERLHFAIQNCEIEQSEVDRRVKKILAAKCWAGLDHYSPIKTENIYNELNTDSSKWLDYTLYESSITLLKNENKVLPLSPYYRDCMASLVLNDSINNNFQKALNIYGKVDCYALPKDAPQSLVDSLLRRLNEYDRVIVSIHNTSTNAAKNFGLTDVTINTAAKISHWKKSVLCVFGNAYVLGKLKDLEFQDVLVQCYEDTYYPQWITAQKIFGVSSFTGKLPVTINADIAAGVGLSSSSVNLLKYTMPEDLGIESSFFLKSDSIINAAIRDSVMPGCQIVYAVNNKVIYSKSFGYFTYDSTRAVTNNDLYDIASVTKLSASGLAAMLLYEKHKLDPQAKASKYLPELRHSNKKDITVDQLLAHQAGLVSWIPFYKSTIDSNGLKDDLYRKTEQRGYSIQITDSLYLKDEYKEVIWKTIIDSEVNPTGKYLYSDVGIIILQHIIEKITGTSIDEYVADNFYKPMGLWNTGYLPLKRFDKSIIVPTELDTVFRNCLVQGFVHDPAAAMLGGVAGHAGVFTNAQSLATIMKMLLDGGMYGGKRFLKKETILKFTAQAFPGTDNRRGYIFDKPELDPQKNGPTAKSASPRTFGHTGFTGTCAWADPEHNIIFIFLSNRVYPSATNNKLAKQNIRTNLMQVLYDALGVK